MGAGRSGVFFAFDVVKGDRRKKIAECKHSSPNGGTVRSQLRYARLTQA